MSLLADHIKWIMLLSGALTCTILCATLAPKAAFQSTFGESHEGLAAEIVGRNWGALITLSGAMVIYGAFEAPGHRFILLVLGAGKLIFVGLILAQGRRYLTRQAGGGVAVAADLVMVALFSACLVGS